MDNRIQVPRRTALLGGLSATLLSACNQRPATDERASGDRAVADLPVPSQPTPAAVQFSAAATAFGQVVIERLMAERPKDTVMVSPLSLMSVLAMLGQGARGDTAAELGAALGLDGEGLALRSAPEAYRSLMMQLADTPNELAATPAKVDVANGVWVDRRIGLDRAFAKTQSEAFSAKIASADFRDPRLPEAINQFVSKATAGAIPAIVGELDPDAVLAIVSALHFKAGWDEYRFERALTREEDFTTAGGATIKTPLMCAKGWFAFHETAAFKVVAVPYADLRFELVLVLPATTSLPKGWASAALAGLNSAGDAGGRTFRPGDVFVPRLDLTWGADLVGALRSLGLTKTMGPSPDFGGAATQRMAVSQVAHRTVFEMDEAGTEAAAATSMAAPAADAEEVEPPKPFVFRADRPFGLMVRENRAGAPLFMGYVSSPRS